MDFVCDMPGLCHSDPVRLVEHTGAMPEIMESSWCRGSTPVQTGREAAASLGVPRRAPKVEGAGEEARGGLGEQRERGEIGVDGRLQAHILHLHRHLAPVRQPCLVHLQLPDTLPQGGPSSVFPRACDPRRNGLPTYVAKLGRLAFLWILPRLR